VAVHLTLETSGDAGISAVLTCAHCSEVIIKSTSDGGGKVRGSKIILLKHDGVYAVCKSCDSEVRLPLVWTRDLGPPLYLAK